MSPVTASRTIGYLDVEDWMEFRDSLCDPDDPPQFVVAVARKMPRILEYLGAHAKKMPCPVVSERALPWLAARKPLEGHVVLCDDVLNIGTTLSHYALYARKLGFERVSVRVYARREKKREIQDLGPLANLRVNVRHSFDETAYRRFESALPQELLKIGKPYDIDFPIISLPLQKEQAARSPEDWLDALSECFCSVHDLTTPTQRDVGVTSMSIIDPLDVDHQRRWTCGSPHMIPTLKVRIYISQRDQLMRLVPMCVLGVPETALSGGVAPFHGDLGRLFSSLSPQAKAGSPFALESPYILATYLASFEYGMDFLQHVSRDLFGADRQRADVEESDLCLLFGPHLAGELRSQLRAHLRTPRSRQQLRAHLPAYDACRMAAKSDLLEQVRLQLVADGYKGSAAAEVFRQTMRILDDIAKAEDPPSGAYPDYARLRSGLPLMDLWLLARDVCAEGDSLSYEHASFLLDYFVDVGVIVPVIESMSGVYCRTYRQGEADPPSLEETVHALLVLHAKHFPTQRLTTTAFAKILSALAVYHPQRIPLLPVFARRGRVPYVVSSGELTRQEEDAIAFLRRRQIIRIEAAEKNEDGDQLTLL